MALEPAAGVIVGFAEVPVEGRVTDRRLPRPRRVRSEAGGEWKDPGRPRLVEVDQLGRAERAAEPSAQLGDDPLTDELEDLMAVGRSVADAPITILPPVNGGFQGHPA
jgi:hypothetical protein